MSKRIIHNRDDIISVVASKIDKMLNEYYIPKHVILWEGYSKGVFWIPLLPFASNITDIKTILGLEIIYTEKPNTIEVY